MNRPYLPHGCSLRRRPAAILVGLALAGATACGSSDPTTTATTASSTTAPAPVVEPIVDPGDGGDYRPELDPASFVEGIDTHESGPPGTIELVEFTPGTSATRP